MDMKTELLEYVRQNDFVTFAELRKVLGEPMAGDWMVGNESANVWFWAGLSDDFMDALDALISAGAIVYAPTSKLCYMIDGGSMNYPVAGPRVPKGGYKRPRWLPVCLRPTGAA